MALPRTEGLHPDAPGIDAVPGGEALRRLLAGQRAAVGAVEGALPALETGVALMVAALRGEGRLVYAGAGSSGLMAMADALELPGTYGVDPGRIVILMAGGLPRDSRMPGHTEDDTAAARADAAGIGAGDVVIAVAARTVSRTRWPNGHRLWGLGDN